MQLFIIPRESVVYDDEDVHLWPLVKSLEVEIPSKLLPKGAQLIDLPGKQDADAARMECIDEVSNKYFFTVTSSKPTVLVLQIISETDRVWIVGDCNRNVDDGDFEVNQTHVELQQLLFLEFLGYDISQKLIDEQMKRTIALDGHINSMTVVCTKSDSLAQETGDQLSTLLEYATC